MGSQPSGTLDLRNPERLAAVWRKAKMQAERCGAHTHAEDIAQTVVISLWRLPPGGDDWSAVALVYARRCVARIIAQRERAQACLDECRMVVPSAEPSTLQRWLQERERTLLANALEELRTTEPDWFGRVARCRLIGHREGSITPTITSCSGLGATRSPKPNGLSTSAPFLAILALCRTT